MNRRERCGDLLTIQPDSGYSISGNHADDLELTVSLYGAKEASLPLHRFLRKTDLLDLRFKSENMIIFDNN